MMRKLLKVLVGARGFEPPTPASRTRCATGLRYAPITTYRYLKGPEASQPTHGHHPRLGRSIGLYTNLRPCANLDWL